MNTNISDYGDIPVTCISDAMGGLSHLDSAIKPLKNHYKVIGRVYTVTLPVAENLLFLQAIKEANQGDIIVVDAKGHPDNAVCGDFIAGLAQTLGIAGLVIDGVVRDLSGIQELNFPVFCKGVTVAAGNKNGGGALNVPISCGDAVVKPGDIIFGDENGVICVPKENEQNIMIKAKEKLNKDIERDNMVGKDQEKVRTYIEDTLRNNALKMP